MIFVFACLPTWISISMGIGTPFDEIAHFDYADKLAHLELPKVNELYGQRTLRIIACQKKDPGIAWAGVRTCDATVINAAAAPFNGQSSATSYSPTYYSVIAINYQICINSLGKVISISALTCMRISNSLLAGVSAVLLALTGVT